MNEVWVQVVTTVGVVIVAVIQAAANRRLKVIGRDAAEARSQTANTHDTNLRHDIDNIAAKVDTLADTVETAAAAAETAAAAAERAGRAADRVEAYVRDVDTSVRSVQHSLDRQVGILNRRVQEVEETIPATVRAALAEHQQGES